MSNMVRKTPLNALPTPAIFFLAALFLLPLIWGCAPPPVQMTGPSIAPPKTVFLIERDYKTVWNALARALEQMPEAEIWSSTIEEGKITLRDATVSMAAHCDCGSVGPNPLSGTVSRMTTISVGREAPQLTRIRIQCIYTTPFAWDNVYGGRSKARTLECVSTGAFEKDLFERTMQFLKK